jgi:hypothetical protein
MQEARLGCGQRGCKSGYSEVVCGRRLVLRVSQRSTRRFYTGKKISKRIIPQKRNEMGHGR